GSFDISENPYAINIYPNPTTDFINVKWNTGVKVARIKIFNISGKEVMNQIVTEKYFQIDIRSFEKGIYFLSVNDSVFRKVVKM
ncbi:MAG TPA: T9SS type A sorting domain-containing protein, partial [Bacteroidia bacterium]|nr:T9SS type A sorting domain-containing protein [Bacteroidia bacterium]